NSRLSGTLTTPTFGSMVQNGKFALCALAFDKQLKRVDFPTFGNPTIPAFIYLFFKLFLSRNQLRFLKGANIHFHNRIFINDFKLLPVKNIRFCFTSHLHLINDNSPMFTTINTNKHLMKKLLMSIAIIGLCNTALAQVNKSVKEESTTKRVVIKEGSDVKITETKKTETESGGLIIEDNNKIDRNFREVTKQDSDKKMLVKDEFKDAKNEALIEQKREAQQAQLEASKRA